MIGKYGINEINKQFNKKYQMLCSYKLEFNFKTDSGILSYLDGKSFVLDYKFTTEKDFNDMHV